MHTGPNIEEERKPFWVGFAQILLAVLMYLNPFFTLTILTFFVAVTFMLLGGVQVAVAIQYRERMAAKVLMLISGAAAGADSG